MSQLHECRPKSFMVANGVVKIFMEDDEDGVPSIQLPIWIIGQIVEKTFTIDGNKMKYVESK